MCCIRDMLTIAMYFIDPFGRLSQGKKPLVLLKIIVHASVALQ